LLLQLLELPALVIAANNKAVVHSIQASKLKVKERPLVTKALGRNN
jgi:hypothetical protein